MTGRLIAVVGASGIGKDTVKQAVASPSQKNDHLHRVISQTLDRSEVSARIGPDDCMELVSLMAQRSKEVGIRRAKFTTTLKPVQACRDAGIRAIIAAPNLIPPASLSDNVAALKPAERGRSHASGFREDRR